MLRHLDPEVRTIGGAMLLMRYETRLLQAVYCGCAKSIVLGVTGLRVAVRFRASTTGRWYGCGCEPD